MQLTDVTFYNRYQVQLINDANTEQQEHFSQWTGINPKILNP